MTNAEEHYNKGIELLNKDDFQMAASEFTQAMHEAFGEKNLRNWAEINRGIAYFNLKNYSQARADWLEVLRFDDDPERINATKGLFDKLPEAYRS